MRVPFLNLEAQYRSIREDIDAAIAEVIRTSRFILGSEETKFERLFADSLRMPHAVGCSCGTSALYIALKALNLPAGAEVIVPAMTYIATAEAVSLAGGRPMFVDVEPDTGLMDFDAMVRAVTSRTWGLIPVHLYGQMVDMPRFAAFAKARGLCIVEDAAQAHAAAFQGRGPGSFSDAAAFSFFPGKNLGAYGDAGAIVTRDPSMAAWMRRYRNHGRQDKYEHEFVGFNFRLDGIQAAVLQAKLQHLERWTERRRAIAGRYRAGLASAGVRCLVERTDARHVYHLFVIRHPARDRLRKALAERGIETGIHYPIPLHLQPAYQSLGPGPGALPGAEALAREVLSLPIDPELTDEQVQYVIEELCAHA
jgi:dTDP-4-amino-4,6-dideoxygalactose transaminase